MTERSGYKQDEEGYEWKGRLTSQFSGALRASPAIAGQTEKGENLRNPCDVMIQDFDFFWNPIWPVVRNDSRNKDGREPHFLGSDQLV